MFNSDAVYSESFEDEPYEDDFEPYEDEEEECETRARQSQRDLADVLQLYRTELARTSSNPNMDASEEADPVELVPQGQ